MALRDVPITPGSGDNVEFDDKNQVIKLKYGASVLEEQPATAAKQDTANTSLGAIEAAVHDEDAVAPSGATGVFVLAVRQDADTSAASDGDFTALKMDETGRLKTSALPASIAPTTANITANSQSIGLDVSRYSNLMIYCTGTFSTVNVAFEGSLTATTDTDGNWFSVQAIRSNANTIETTTGNLSAAPAYAWELSVNALKRFRVRSTAWTSGTQVWAFQPGSYATEPIPGAQISGTQPVSGTVTASGCVGPAAHDAAISGNPLRGAARALTANYTAVASGDVADHTATLVGAQIIKQFSIPEAEFVGIDDITASTTAKQIKNATASNQNYVTGISLGSDTLGAAGDIQLRSTPVASTTATIASNTLVMAATYNWKVGDMVYVTASTVTGLTAATYYYILTVSAANLTFSATRGGSTLAISGTTVSATLAKVLFRHRLQTTSLPLTHARFNDPIGGGTNLAIEACTPVSLSSGRVDFNVHGYVAP